MNVIMLNTMENDFFEFQEPKKKKNVRGPSKATVEQTVKSSTVAESAVQEIYDYWCLVMRPNRKNPARLDVKGRDRVAAAIKDFGMETCRRAIDGCAVSDFHMGRNKRGRRYDSLDLIFRSHDNVERFLGYLVEGGADPW